MSQGSSKKCKMSSVSSADFFKALKKGNVEGVRSCLQVDNSLINAPVDIDKVPPLVCAVTEHSNSGTSALQLVELVRVLLEYKADIHAKAQAGDDHDDCGKSALDIAVEKDLVELVDLLLQSPQAKVEKRDKDALARSLLRIQSVEMLRLLISHGADVNCTASKDVDSPIWFLAIEGIISLEAFQVVFEQVGDQDRQATWGTDGLSALHEAARHARLEIMEYLLDLGADVNARATNGRTPLHYAAGTTEGDDEVTPFLLQRGADVNATDQQGKTAFAFVSYDGIAQSLIEHGADISRDAKEAILNAVETQDYNICLMELILEQGKLDLNERVSLDDDSSETVAFAILESVNNHGRAYEGLEPILMMLIQHGADVNARHGQSGQTLLHFACVGYGDYGDSEEDTELAPVVRLPLEKGSPVNATDNQGWTPVWIASRDGKWKIVKALVQNGADVNVGWERYCASYCTPLSLACESKQLRMVRLLLDAGAQIDYRDKDGVTYPLLICVKKGFVRCAKLLVERGADIHHAGHRRQDGYTPFVLACKKGKLDMIYCLIRFSPHHQRLGLLSQESYPFASTGTGADSDDDDNIDGDDYSAKSGDLSDDTNANSVDDIYGMDENPDDDDDAADAGSVGHEVNNLFSDSDNPDASDESDDIDEN